MTDMACDEFVDIITAYLEGDLPAADRARFDAHVPECPFCEAYLVQMRATITRLGTPDTLPPALRAALLDAARRA